MRVSEVSKRYAKALLAATKQKGVHAKALAEIEALVQSFTSDASVKNYFSSPMISAAAKVAVLKETLSGKGVSEEVMGAILLLGEKNRLNILEQVAIAFRELLDGEQGLTRGVVKSAQPLSAEAQKEIENKVKNILKKEIVLTFEQDPKLLGGVVAHVGGWTFDDSVETHLKKLNEELNRRAN